MKYPLLVLFVLIVLLFGLFGCSMTPAQQYRLAAAAYDGGAITAAGAHGAALASGRSNPALWAKVQADEALLAADLADSYKWLQDNPNLANVPGLALPPLNPFHLLLGQLHLDTLGLNLVPLTPPAPPAPLLPPPSPPATLPAVLPPPAPLPATLPTASAHVRLSGPPQSPGPQIARQGPS